MTWAVVVYPTVNNNEHKCSYVHDIYATQQEAKTIMLTLIKMQQDFDDEAGIEPQWSYVIEEGATVQ